MARTDLNKDGEEQENSKEIKKKQYNFNQDFINNKLHYNLPIGILYHDPKEEVIYCNLKATKLLELNEDELLGKTAKDLMQNVIHEHGSPYPGAMHPVTRAIVYKKEITRIKLGYFQPKSGVKLWLQLNAYPDFNEDGSINGVLCTIENISERKHAEDKLVRLSQAVEQSQSSIVITDIKGNIQYINKKAKEVSGYEASELLGENPRMLKSGYTSSEEYKKLWKNLCEGREWRGEFHNKRKNGELYWESAVITPIINESGEIISYLAIKEDISERKKAEKVLKERNIELSKTNKELDRFVYSTSHELRAPLTSIMGLFSLLNKKKIDEENKKILELINGSIYSMDATLKDILNYSKNARNEIRMEKIEIKECIENAFHNYDFINTKLIYDKRIHVDATDDLYSDMGRVKVILNNLIGNAIKYAKKDNEDSFIEVRAEINSNFLKIEIQDNGIGIESEYLPEIFSMFYRATTTGLGSGLGLYIVKECVEKLKGSIHIESEIHVGTKCVIEIPNSI